MKRTVLLILAAVMVAAGTVMAPAAYGASDTTVLYEKKEVQEIIRGLTYEKSSRLYKTGWLDVYVLTLDASETNLSLEILENVNTYGTKATVEKLAKDNGVIAGINGDFFGSGSLRSSMGQVAEDGAMTAAQNYYNGSSWQYAGLFVDTAGTPFIDYVKTTLSFVTADKVAMTLGAKNKMTDFSKPVYFDRSAISSTADMDRYYSTLTKMVVENGVITYISSPGETVNVPENGYIIVMNSASREYYLPYYTVGTAVGFYDNEAFYIRPEKNISDITFGISGGGEVLRNGEIVQYGYAVSPSSTQPRTLVGVNKDKSKIYLVCIDGRKNGKGATNYECGAILKSYGVYDAIHMDGGGSTTMVVQENGAADVSVVNVPSEGSQRAVANGIGISANGPAGVAAAISAEVKDSDDNIMFDGFGSAIRTVVYDGQLKVMNVAESQISYSSSLKGSWSGNVFTPQETGTGTITVSYGDVSKTIDITVMKGIAALRAEAGSYALVSGQKTALTATALNPQGYSLGISQDQVTWTADGSGVGHIENGSFVADREGVCTVTASGYGVTGQLKITVGKKYVAINSFEGSREIVNHYYPEDGSVTGGGTIDSTVSYDGNSSLRIDYKFQDDTVTTQCVYAGLENSEVRFPSGVSEFEIWYKGDGSGNALKAVMYYGNDQTADVTIAASMDSTSWQKAVVQVPAGAVSGIRLNKIYVASYGTDGKAVSGTVHVDYILAQASTSSEGGSASSGDDYMAADLSKLNGSYSSMTFTKPTENVYSIRHQDDYTILTLGVTGESLTSNNASQWQYLQEALGQYAKKNVIVKLSVNPWTGISEIKERTALHDILKTAERTGGHNIIVMYPGSRNLVEIKDGIRYMSVASSVQFLGNSQSLYYQFK